MKPAMIRLCSVYVLVLAAAWPAAAQEVNLALSDNDHGLYRVQGGFQVSASSACIWEVLTDYEALPERVPAIETSRVAQRWGRELLLRQTASERIFFMRRRVRFLLDVQEDPFERLTFRDVSKADFKTYEGEWRIEASSGAYRVDYSLEAEPNFLAPAFLARRIIRKDIGKLLAATREEILRRTPRGPGVTVMAPQGSTDSKKTAFIKSE